MARLAVPEGNCYFGFTMETARPMSVALGEAAAGSDEALLVGELQAGSEDAFVYLLRVYQNPVYNLVVHIVEATADAPDVLQNVFIKVFRGIRHFHGESSLRTWIYRIAVHEASNHRRGWLRRKWRETFSLDDDGVSLDGFLARSQAQPDTPYDLAEKSERQRVVHRALATLAQPYRAAIVLREIEGLSYDEIAHVLGVSEGTVKSRLIRGRELLRRKLQGYWGRSDV